MREKTHWRSASALILTIILILSTLPGLAMAASGQETGKDQSNKNTGFVEIDDIWYYYDQSGKIVDSDIVQDTTGEVYNKGKATWWYIEDSVVNTDFTGLAQNDFGWWYMEDGTCHFNYTGLVQNEYGWWYIEDSHCNFNWTGLTQNEYGWWYIENSHCNFNWTGLTQNEYGWWYIEDSHCNFNFTGLAQNDYGWWYVEKSHVTFTFTGLVPNDSDLWYVENSRANLDFSGLVQDGFNLWYVLNGRVDFSHCGINQNEDGWWYVKNGKVDTDYTVKVDSAFAEELFELVNEERSAEGLPTLSLISSLDMAAITRAGELAFNFSHTRPNGSSWDTIFPEFGLEVRGAGENAALGQSSPSRVMRDWMDSPEHKANIMNANYTAIGIGCVQITYEGKSVYYWDQLFIW